MNPRRFVEGLQELRALWLGRRARAAVDRGDLQNAERLNRKAVAVMERALGEVEQTAVYVFNLAEVLAAQERFVEAEKHYRRGLAMDEADLGRDHPRRRARFLLIARQLASVLRRLGRERDAAELEAQAAALETPNAAPPNA